MSLALDKIAVRKVTPDLLNFSDHFIPIVEGPARSQYMQVQPSGTPSNTSINFQVTPPSGVVMSRKVLLSTTATLTISGVPANNQPLLKAGYFGPRAYPLHSLMESCNVNINGTCAVTAIPAKHLHAFSRIGGKDMAKRQCMTATYLDNCTSYDGKAAAGGPGNPHGYASQSAESVRGRGSMQFSLPGGNPVGDASGNVKSCTLQVSLAEFLEFSPFTTVEKKWIRPRADHERELHVLRCH